MIVLDRENRIFTLHTLNTTYQMKADQYNVLQHIYYGSRIDDCDMSFLIQCGNRSFTPNPNEAGSNRNYSLDVMPQEYSTCGVGDFRLPSVELELKTAAIRWICAIKVFVWKRENALWRGCLVFMGRKMRRKHW